jgi:hypothetical protein
MAERGAQEGNTNASKERIIRRKLVAIGEQEDWARLRKGLEAQFNSAAAGDLPAMMFIRDTVDGKPHQSIGNEDGTSLFTGITITVVHSALPVSATRLLNEPGTTGSE